MAIHQTYTSFPSTDAKGAFPFPGEADFSVVSLPGCPDPVLGASNGTEVGTCPGQTLQGDNLQPMIPSERAEEVDSRTEDEQDPYYLAPCLRLPVVKTVLTKFVHVGRGKPLPLPNLDD